MEYEENSLKEQQLRDSLTIAPRQKQFETPQLDMRIPEDLSGLSKEDILARKEAYQREQTKTADSAIQRILTSAREKDAYGKDMKEVTTFSSKSSWLITRTIPTQSSIGESIDDATKAFRIASLSDSQKTKRGKKFQKKAIQQAKMINLMNQCHWRREESLNDLLEHGRNARYGTDVVIPGPDTAGQQVISYHDDEKATFLDNVGKDLDQVSVQMRDLSFYFEQKRSDNAHPVTGYQYKPLEQIADPATRNKGYMAVFEEFEKLDLSVFDYKDNDEFMQSEGEKAFVKRYAALRAFSHVKDMLHVTGRAEIGEKRYFELSAKADVIQEILEDYNSRAILLQSPYHVLLAGKDFDALSNEDIQQRIDNTEDILVKAYMKQVLERRQKNHFKKGSSANDMLKKARKDQSWRTARDKTETTAMNNRLSGYVDVYLKDFNLTQKDRSEHASFKSRFRRLTSFLFRKNAALPVEDMAEKELETQYEEEKKKQQGNLPLEKWVNDKLATVDEKYVKAASDVYKNYFSLKDPNFYFKRGFIENSQAILNTMKNNDTFRKDYTGSLRQEHLKKYKEKTNFKDSMVEEDVNALVDNILADNLLDEKDVDMSILDEKHMTYMKVYALFNIHKEGSVLEPELEAARCANEISNIEDLLKKDPGNREELENRLDALKQEKGTFTVRKKISEAFSLKMKNRSETIKTYWNEKQKLKAVNEAQRLIEKNDKGAYRDAMLQKLSLMEKEQKEKMDYQLLLFETPIATSLNIEDPFTKAQNDIFANLAETADRIEELKKEGKAGEEEALKLLEKTRIMMESYDDKEYQDFLKITA